MAAGDGGYTLPIMTAAEYGPPLKMSGVEKWVTAADTRVRYFQAGSGPPLILLHGLGEAAVIWYANVEPLAREYTVYVPDLPGHGASAEPPWQYSLEGSVHFLEEFMNALDLQRASIVGNSLGGLSLGIGFGTPSAGSPLVLEDAAGLDARLPDSSASCPCLCWENSWSATGLTPPNGCFARCSTIEPTSLIG